MRRLISVSILALVLISTLILRLKLLPAVALCDICLYSDGSVIGTDKIEYVGGGVFVLTGNITECIGVYNENITIDGCGFTLEGDPAMDYHGMEVWYCHNATIRNLTVKGFHFGICIKESSNINLISNTFEIGQLHFEEAGIYLLSSSDCNITGNRFSNCSQGIWTYYSNTTNISDNQFTDNEGHIFLQSSAYNTVSENNMVNSTFNGVGLHQASNNGIYRNTIMNHNVTFSEGAGISLSANSENNTLTENTIANYDYGMRFHFANGNLIAENTVVNNHEGIHLTVSSGNRFSNNNFTDNTQHVNITTPGSVNFWNATYPDGNYWSNYTDTDQFSGTCQNETGSDWRWDNPYVIDEYNQDNYPIVAEFSATILLPFFMLCTLLTTVFYRRKSKACT